MARQAQLNCRCAGEDPMGYHKEVGSLARHQHQCLIAKENSISFGN